MMFLFIWEIFLAVNFQGCTLQQIEGISSHSSDSSQIHRSHRSHKTVGRAWDLLEISYYVTKTRQLLPCSHSGHHRFFSDAFSPPPTERNLKLPHKNASVDRDLNVLGNVYESVNVSII